MKRERVGIPEPDTDHEDKAQYDLLDFLTCGDIYPNVLGRLILSSPSFTLFCFIYLLFSSPVFKNEFEPINI